jgi:hypothetical protein
MKFAIIKRPRWLVLFAVLILWAASYYGAVGLDYLQAHDPPRLHQNMLDDRFDGVIIFILCPLMIIGAVGSVLSALWCVCRLIAEIISYVRSRHTA